MCFYSLNLAALCIKGWKEEKLKRCWSNIDWALCEDFSLLAPSDTLSGNIPEFSNLYSCFESIMRSLIPYAQVFGSRMVCFPTQESMLFISRWKISIVHQLAGEEHFQYKIKGNYAAGLRRFDLLTGGEQKIESLQNEWLGEMARVHLF